MDLSEPLNTVRMRPHELRHAECSAEVHRNGTISQKSVRLLYIRQVESNGVLDIGLRFSL